MKRNPNTSRTQAGPAALDARSMAQIVGGAKKKSMQTQLAGDPATEKPIEGETATFKGSLSWIVQPAW